MFPIGDASRRPRHFPLVTTLIIGANVVVFLLELAGGDAFWSGSVTPKVSSQSHLPLLLVPVRDPSV
jgi:membrane associated rhomboid family serine protease